jgi:hypothetical protein
MRSLRTLLATTLIATGAIAVAGATPASAVTVNCGLKSMSIVFWPKGNKANHLAHMDFYTLSRSSLLGRIDREGGGTFVPRCKHRSQPKLHAVTRASRTTRATALRCRFPRTATIAVHPISSEDEELGIHVVVGTRSVLFAQLYSDHAPKLAYDKVYCHRARLPG